MRLRTMAACVAIAGMVSGAAIALSDFMSKEPVPPELASAGKAIADFAFAKEDLQSKASKKRNSTFGNDLEEFMALEQIKEKEEELKKIMIYLGRPGLWQDWQAFQAEARKSRRYAEKMAEKRREEIMEYLTYFIVLMMIAGFCFLLALVYMEYK